MTLLWPSATILDTGANCFRGVWHRCHLFAWSMTSVAVYAHDSAVRLEFPEASVSSSVALAAVSTAVSTEGPLRTISASITHTSISRGACRTARCSTLHPAWHGYGRGKRLLRRKPSLFRRRCVVHQNKFSGPPRIASTTGKTRVFNDCVPHLILVIRSYGARHMVFSGCV